MSEPFLNPYDTPTGKSWQDMLDEITLAYSERRQSLGQTAYDATDGKDVHAAAYWIMFQSWIEQNCVYFLDHINPFITYQGNPPQYLSFETFLAVAGLNVAGFTRKYGSSESPTTAYGHMEEKDIIGPWIFEELQKAFSALKWTPANPTTSYEQKGSPASYYLKEIGYIGVPASKPFDLGMSLSFLQPVDNASKFESILDFTEWHNESSYIYWTGDYDTRNTLEYLGSFAVKWNFTNA